MSLRSLRRNAALAAARVPKALEALDFCRACVRYLYNSLVMDGRRSRITNPLIAHNPRPCFITP